MSYITGINAACRIPGYQRTFDSGLAGLLLCTTDTEILISSLVLKDQVVPRRFHLGNYPYRMTFSHQLSRLIVSTNHMTQPAHEGTTSHGQAVEIARALETHDPGSNYHGLPSPESNLTATFGNADDRIRCMLNWTPSDGTKHYDMILIGVDADSSDERRRLGKLLCISTKYLTSGSDVASKVKTISKYPSKPIYALCPYGASSLLIAAGDDLILRSLDITTRKWSTLAQCTLPSPAMSLSVQDDLIYAATSRHSLLVVKQLGNGLKFLAADKRARNCTDVLPLGDLGTFAATISGRGTELIGFAAQPEGKTLTTAIEAVLPVSIHRLQQGYPSPEDQSVAPHFYGASITGTFYRFRLLSLPEWKLLRFLEDLKPPQRKRIDKDSDDSSSDGSCSSWSLISPGSSPKSRPPPPERAPDLSQRHINGDILAGLLELGVNSLQELLEPEIKVEEEVLDGAGLRERLAQFRSLAPAVVGDEREMILAVSRWLRRLLRMPQ